MWDFISANWVWLLFAGGIVVMHLGHGRPHGHGGQGGHGGHGGCGGGHATTPTVDKARNPDVHRHAD